MTSFYSMVQRQDPVSPVTPGTWWKGPLHRFARSRKAQTALDFLLCYGWLVLVVVMAAVALYTAG